MPRQLTLQAVRQSIKENASDPFLVLLTIEVDAPGQSIRVVNNTEDIVSRGQTYIGCPFSIALPDINDHTMSEAQLSIDNVDPRIWQGVRALDTAPSVLLEVIMASEPDAPMFRSEGLRLREASADLRTVSGKLIPDTIWRMGFPAHEFDPSQNPGMFGT